MKKLIFSILCLMLFSCQKEVVSYNDTGSAIRYGKDENIGENSVTSTASTSATTYGNVSVQLLLNLVGGPSNSADGVRAFFNNERSIWVWRVLDL